MEKYILNPETNRMVKIGSQTYRKLVNKKIIKNKVVDDRILYKYDSDDDIEELKKKYKDEINENEIIQIGKGKYKNKLIKTYKGDKGRPKKIFEEKEEDDINDLINSMLINNKSDSESDNLEYYESD